MWFAARVLWWFNPRKVQQRGVEATKSIILQLLDGMVSGQNQPVLIVDMLPSRLGVSISM